MSFIWQITHILLYATTTITTLKLELSQGETFLRLDYTCA